MNRFLHLALLAGALYAGPTRAQDALTVYRGAEQFQWIGIIDAAVIGDGPKYVEITATASIGDGIFRDSFEPLWTTAPWQIVVTGIAAVDIRSVCEGETIVIDGAVGVVVWCDE